jgi:hypothetical protein
MRRTIAALAFIALAVTACGTTTSSLPATPTGTPGDRGYDAVLERPPGTVKTPDFTLPSATSGEMSLASLRGSKPLAIVFYRGFF